MTAANASADEPVRVSLRLVLTEEPSETPVSQRHNHIPGTGPRSTPAHGPVLPLDTSLVSSPSATHGARRTTIARAPYLKFGTGIDGFPVLPASISLRGVKDRNPFRPEPRRRKHKVDGLMVRVEAQQE
jgi:hypothetical protein